MLLATMPLRTRLLRHLVPMHRELFDGMDRARPFVCLPHLYRDGSIPSKEFLKDPPNVFEAYANSKTITYHVAPGFVKERKVAFHLVHVLPGYIQGANELNEKPEDVKGGSNSATMGVALGQVSEGPKLTGQVLLEDVAKANVLALEEKVAPHLANLIIAGNGGQGIPWAQIAEIIESNYPDEVNVGILRPAKDQQDWLTHFDVRSSEDALGFQFAGGEEMARSVVNQYLQLLKEC